MDYRLKSRLSGTEFAQWEALLRRAGLEPDTDTDRTVLAYDGPVLAAAGSRKEGLLKCIAVEADYRGEDLTAAVLTRLRQDAFENGFRHLFLYTKPENRLLFGSLLFYPIARTDKVLLMEDRPDGIRKYLESLPPPPNGGTAAALVMNCNPFTLGHLHLIRTAAAECDRVYVFVLSQPQPPFSPEDRLEMVRLGTRDIPNVTVLPTGPYLISRATFPTYFLKNREEAGSVHCALDIAIFEKYFVPRLGITHRYVGTEPLSPMTNAYNTALKAGLTRCVLREIPRLEDPEGPVSASRVRARMAAGESLEGLVPPTTAQYLIQGGFYHA